MKKATLAVAIVVAVLLVAYVGVFQTRPGQDWILRRLVSAQAGSTPVDERDVLRIFVCGSASPLGVSDRAQACIAVLAGERVYLVDTGAGSAATLARGGIPLARLERVFFTHFHSDHISALGDINLGSWVAGRERPLQVHGPRGVDQVVDGFNAAYALDRNYRVAHHGSDLLPPTLGVMEAAPFEPGVVLDEDGLVVTAFEVDHAPIRPAVGYRFDYGGRSVVVSGDTNAVASTLEISRGVDLLLHDALALPLLTIMRDSLAEAGVARVPQIMTDVLDYHAHTEQVVALAEEAGVAMLALYHLVPVPGNALFERVFRRGLPASVVLADDGMLFELPVASEEIEITQVY